MTAPRAVTFDLWHTLVYLPPADESTYMARLTEAAVEVLAAAPTVPGATPATRSELGERVDEESRAAVLAAREGRSVTPEQQIQAAGRRLGRRPAPGAYEIAIAALLARTEFLVEPAASEVLGTLRDEGYRLGLISNTVGEPGRLLRPVLAQFGLERFFDVCVFSDQLPWTKPAPEIFRAAVAALGSDPQHAIHVGDGWPDVEGARRAGLRASVLFTGLQQYAEEYRAIYARERTGELDATATIAHLPELLPIVHRFLPAAP